MRVKGMTCLDWQLWLQQRLDGEEPPASTDLEAHLAVCSHCRALSAALGKLEMGLRRLAVPSPAADLSPRIVARILAERRSAQRRRPVLAFALAAGVVLAILAGSHWLQSPSDFARTVPPPSVTPSPPIASLQDHMVEATSAMANLTRRTADETVAQGRLLWPSVPLPALDQAVRIQPFDPPAQSLREAGQSVSNSLEPVTTSAQRAFSLFLRDLPPVAPEGKRQL